MNEEQFANEITGLLKEKLSDKYDVRSKGNLQHTLIFGADGKVWPEVQPFREKRGVYAYQTDILVARHDKVPLVAIELKCRRNLEKKGSFNFGTHDLLTYSAKATRHKELYPYLRYGVAAGGAPSIGRKFFLHNRAFDFVIAVPDPRQLDKLAQVVRHQAQLAEERLKLLDRKAKKGVICWQNGMKWEWATTQDDEDTEDTDHDEE
jgi:hypothetical protein